MSSLMFKRPRGTQDILPPDVSSWQEIERIAKTIFSLYNYQEIRTPILEETSLFNRSLGKTTEIVQKQMFEIKQDSLVLRPEATAPVVRAYLENNLDSLKGFSKFYYFGPMFRAERPQKGRLRQFHHLGVEAIGSLSPDLDVEVIALSERLLKGFNITDYQIWLNSLGCCEDKLKLARDLRQKLKNRLSKLCPDCQARFQRNVFRILDCKNIACQEVIKKLDLKQGEFLCPDCSAHFQRVVDGLDSLNISYVLSPKLVRGLDYYTRTVFEVKHPRLGAQDALGAGGRYDNLIEELGGPKLGAIGFALGVERILLVSNLASAVRSGNLVYIITLGEEAKKAGLKLLDALRKTGITSDTDYVGKSLKGAMRKANDLGARFVLIIGEDELKKNVVTLKDMLSGEQREIRQEDLIEELKKHQQKAEVKVEVEK